MINKAIIKTNNFFTYVFAKINDFDQTDAGGFVAGAGLLLVFGIFAYGITLYMIHKHK